MQVWTQRALAVTFALAWVQGCATTSTESQPSDASADDSAAATPSASSPGSTNRTAAARLGESTALSAPVSVVALPAADARPCERMCGRVGDCLRDEGNVDASYLELSCLDLCVNVDPSSEVGRQFRACGSSQSTCDPLIGCVSGSWDAAAGARVEFHAEVLTTPGHDACELVCGGMHSCLYHETPLHQFDQRDEQFEREVQSCMSTCDPHLPQIVELAACTNKDTCLEQWECWREAQNY